MDKNAEANSNHLLLKTDIPFLKGGEMDFWTLSIDHANANCFQQFLWQYVIEEVAGCVLEAKYLPGSHVSTHWQGSQSNVDRQRNLIFDFHICFLLYNIDLFKRGDTQVVQ